VNWRTRDELWRFIMTRHAALRFFLFSLVFLFIMFAPLAAQAPATNAANNDADLQYVLIFTRHGVRPPLTKPGEIDKYSAAPWPTWDVQPGYLTPHGFALIKMLGAWDRTKFSSQGLFAAGGCNDATHVSIVADSDERTIETGKALAEGMFPGCGIAVQAKPEGTPDPLFRAVGSGSVHPDPVLSYAAIVGRIGGDANNLVEVFRPQLAALDRVLAGCGRVPANPSRTSIFDIPASLKPGSGDPPVAARGPVPAAATLAENLLLEYTQGFSDADTGWGCLDGATLRFIMQVNIANWEFGYRTSAIARANASLLIDRIEKSIQQSVSGKPVRGALGKPGDRLLVIVGHDSNIAAMAGALRLDWALDGRIDDTPPGGALVFELWRSRADGKPFVRVSYTAQTLEQMRKTEPLTPANPPAEVPIFVPGCGRADLSCSWEGFAAAARQAIDPAYDVAP
jgi:4-phytase / acid phosphatase